MSIQFPIASRVANLPPYPFAVLEQRIRKMMAEGRTFIRMDLGNPDMPPPPNVVQALIESASNPHNHGYTGYRGLANFREAVAAYYHRRFGVKLDPNRQILPLLGSKEGITNLALATVSKGDVVLAPSLSYPAYIMGALMADAEVMTMPINQSNNYRPVISDLTPEQIERAKLLWMCYPNNPTGATVDLAYYQEMVNFCRANNILLCSDNPYLEIMYDGAKHATSVMQADGALETAVEFISCSKTYNMAGWRIGAMVGSAEIIDTLLLVKSNADTGHYKPVYDAATVALNETPQEWLDERNSRYQIRRDCILAALPKIGLEAEMTPKGSMYVWAKVKVHGGDDYAYTEEARNELGVSIAPGSYYGEDGKGYVRFTVGITDTELAEAMNRLQNHWAGKV